MSPDESPELPLEGRHGLYDLSRLHVSQHALERFRERVEKTESPDVTHACMLDLLRICRRLGTNAEGAAAFLGICKTQPFVMIVKGGNVVTCMSLDQFESVMAEFGRHRWPRRFGRWLRKMAPGEIDPGSIETPAPE